MKFTFWKWEITILPKQQTGWVALENLPKQLEVKPPKDSQGITINDDIGEYYRCLNDKKVKDAWEN